uniref:Uncharacterized protein n=1 Tax=Rhizophora mucronata TaxID=61149 RepID=A0A2P2JV68_RHIMU
MRELKAKATNDRKDNAIDAFAIAGNSSLPQLASQSSTRKEAEDDADTIRYARI